MKRLVIRGILKECNSFCMKSISLSFLVSLLMIVFSASSAHAGRILINGADWDTVHHGTNLADDIIAYLDQNSAKDVLVLGNTPATNAFHSTLSHVEVNSLAGINLNDYSGLYVLSINGCCNTNTGIISGFESAINSFVAAGGNLGLQNYIGSPALDPILGTSGGANQYVGGWMGGTNAVGNCYYNGSGLTAAGAAAGFQNGYTNNSCWGHQGYDMSFFSGLGYASLIDTPVAGFSAIMTKENITAVPEPGSLALLGVGLICLGLTRRRYANAQNLGF